MKMKKFLALFLALAMCLSLLVGCGSSSSSSSSGSSSSGDSSEEASSSDSTDEEASSSDSTEEEGSSETADSGESAIIEEMSLASERDPTDLGPWAGNQGGASAIVPLVYQTLFICEYGDLEGETCLAKSRTQTDDAGLVYDVELFDYITDSQGNNLTANDVAFSVETAKEIGKVSSVKVVDSIEVTGDYTFTVTFTDDARMGDFEGFWFQFFIVTQAAYESSSDSMATDPVGTGAYEMTNYVSGNIITFTARDDFWQTDEEYLARSSEAHAKVVNFKIITEAAQRANSIQTGDLDYGAVSSSDLATIEALDDYHITEVADNLTWMLFANVSEGTATSDQLVREAIFWAIDGEGVATAYSNSSGAAVAVYDISNSNYDDYYEDIYKEEAESNYYGYDPDKAMELLEEAGYPNGLTVRLICSSEQAATDVATILEAYLEAVGITLEVNAYQSSLMSEYASDETSWELYMVQYASTDYAVNAWEKVLNETKYSWGGTINFVFDDDLQEMLSTVRTAEGHTQENVVALHDYLIENAWCMGLIQGINYYATSNQITEVVFSDQYIIRPNACIYAEDE
ncbi:MAG: ABC transporter substrate-binding protein [Clostridiales bacterium]|nr:ABC transporter substrate-binding protein [Clostridiales bacterium]